MKKRITAFILTVALLFMNVHFSVFSEGTETADSASGNEGSISITEGQNDSLDAEQEETPAADQGAISEGNQDEIAVLYGEENPAGDPGETAADQTENALTINPADADDTDPNDVQEGSADYQVQNDPSGDTLNEAAIEPQNIAADGVQDDVTDQNDEGSDLREEGSDDPADETVPDAQDVISVDSQGKDTEDDQDADNDNAQDADNNDDQDADGSDKQDVASGDIQDPIPVDAQEKASDDPQDEAANETENEAEKENREEEDPAGQQDELSAAGQTDASAEGQNEADADDQISDASEHTEKFVSGYIYVKNSTIAYSSVNMQNAVGQFDALSVAYAETAQDGGDFSSSILRIRFDTETAKRSGSGLITAYISGRDASIIGNEEAQRLTAQWKGSGTVREYNGKPLPVASYTDKTIHDQDEMPAVQQAETPESAKSEAEDTAQAGPAAGEADETPAGSDTETKESADAEKLEEQPAGIQQEKNTEDQPEGKQEAKANDESDALPEGNQSTSENTQIIGKSRLLSTRGLTLTASGNKLATPTISSHSDRQQISWGDIEDGLTIRWNSVTNGKYYYYAIKMLDGTPGSGDNEAGTMLANNNSTTSRRVTIDREYLIAGRWIKIYVCALANGDYAASDAATIYIYIKPTTQLSKPVITTHSNQQHISWNDVTNGMTVRWNAVSNCSTYYYAIKLLDGEPSSGTSENGTMIALNESTSSKYVTVGSDQLEAKKWVKIYIQANGTGDYTANSTTIYVYIEGKSQLSAPVITSHTNQQTVQYSNLENGLTFKWNAVTNATGYIYAVKLLDGEPNPSDNETGTMLAQANGTTARTVTITQSKLAQNKWVKLYVQAYGSGYNANSTTIYVYVQGKSQLAAPVVTSHTDRQTVQYGNLASGLTFSWNAVTNATGYIYAVKLLDGEPNPSDNETGTMLAHVNGTTTRTVTITQGKLAQNKWVKLYVQAYGSGYNANSTTIYVYVQGKAQLDAPVVTSHTDWQTVQYSNLDSGLTFSWNAVANATGYIYAVKLLDGEPNPSDNEPGTMLTQANGTTRRTVTVAQSKLAQNKWVKLYVQAYGSGYNACSTTIYVYIEGKPQLAAPTVTSHTDRQTVLYGDLNSGLIFCWNIVTNATGYIYAVKLLDGEPNPSENEAGTMLAQVNGTTSRKVVIDQSKLIKNRWVKLYVQAFGSGYTPNSTSIYVYVGEKQLLSAPVVTSHLDRETVLYSALSSGLTFKWNAVTNATGYIYAVKLLTGTPNISDNEPGTILAQSSGTTSRTVTIDQSKLAQGKWVKLYVQAFGGGYNPNSTTVYVYIAQKADDTYTIPGLGVTIDYGLGQFFTIDKKNHGTDKQYDKWYSGAYECWGFSLYVMDKIKANSADKRIKIYYSTKNDTLVKNAIYGAGPGSHIRTNSSNHSYVVTGLSATGMSIIQANGTAAGDYSDYVRNIISVANWSWNDYFSIISYGSRGVYFTEIWAADEEDAIVKTIRNLKKYAGMTTDNAVTFLKTNASDGSKKYSAKYTDEQWQAIKQKADKSQLAAPVITSHTDQQTVLYSSLNDGLTFKWNDVTNAKGFIYAVKLLDGVPNPSENEAGTVLAQANGTTSKSVTIPLNKLAQNKWVKLYVQAFGAGYTANSRSIYVYVEGKPQLAAPTITSHKDRQSVKYSDLNDGLVFCWSEVANATGFIYAVKLLDGAPNSGESEAGILLAQANGTREKSVKIPQNKLGKDKWVKLYIQAFGSGYNANSCTIYVYVTSKTINPLTSEQEKNLAAFKAAYPNGWYWTCSIDDYTVSEATTTPCGCEYRHGGSRPGKGGHPNYYCDKMLHTGRGCGSYWENGTSIAMQCHGYTNLISKEVFGIKSNDWEIDESDNCLDTVSPGDVIRYYESGHSAFVTAVNGTTFTITDCNWSTNCQIRWDVQVTVSQIKNWGTYYVYKHP